MTKSDLVVKMAQSAEIVKEAAKVAIDGLLAVIEGAPVAGEKMTLVGFGPSDVNEQAEREGSYPRTGEKLKIPAKRSVKFTANKPFKDCSMPRRARRNNPSGANRGLRPPIVFLEKRTFLEVQPLRVPTLDLTLQNSEKPHHYSC